MGISGIFVPLQHGLLFGFIAILLTISLTRRIWLSKQDLTFAFSVFFIVTLHRWRKLSYIDTAEKKKDVPLAADLERVNFIYGDDVKIQPGHVYLILFFYSFVADSRAAVRKCKEIQEQYGEAIRVIGLTQESLEEITAYHTKGINASNFENLKEVCFPIGIEDGLMFKMYQLKNNIETLPHCYVVNKKKCIQWHGNPTTSTEYLMAEIDEAVNYISDDDKKQK